MALQPTLPVVSVFAVGELSRSKVSPSFVIMDSQNNPLQRECSVDVVLATKELSICLGLKAKCCLEHELLLIRRLEGGRDVELHNEAKR